VIFIGLAGVTVVYLLVNMALLYVLPAGDIVKLGENAASTAATTLFGGFGGILITIGIIISIFGCLNGKMMAFPRIPYAMAQNGQLPFSKGLAKVHPKFHTPYVSIISQAAIAMVFMLISDPNRLSDISVFSIYLFYIFAFFAVFTLRRRNSGKERPYSVPLYPLVPLVAILGSIYIIVSMLQHDPVGGLGAIFIMVIGLPVYYFLKRKATDQV
jgi:basic amino acid/polyamine antiporter, APA family